MEKRLDLKNFIEDFKVAFFGIFAILWIISGILFVASMILFCCSWSENIALVINRIFLIVAITHVVSLIITFIGMIVIDEK